MNTIQDARAFVARLSEQEMGLIKTAIVEREVTEDKMRESLRDEDEAEAHGGRNAEAHASATKEPIA